MSREEVLEVRFAGTTSVETIAVSFPTIMSRKGADPDLARRLLRLSGHDPKPSVSYHPTAIGVEFLRRIGAVFTIMRP